MILDILVTTYKKNKAEINDLCKTNNYHGRVIIGNQFGSENNSYYIKKQDAFIEVNNIDSIGVSKNRNFLIRRSKADYLLFLDDDAILDDNSYYQLIKIIEQRIKPKGINFCKFNVTCDDLKRQIKQLKSKRRIGFKTLSSFGVIGLVAKRSFIVDNNLFFDESIGPGCQITSGEDTVFYKSICKATKRICSDSIHVARLPISESSWFKGYDRQYFINKGYCAREMYGCLWIIPFVFSCIKHFKFFLKDTSFSKQMKYGREGASLRKKAKPNLQ